MKTRERRVRKTELSLTPQQIVSLCLKNALQMPTCRRASLGKSTGS